MKNPICRPEGPAFHPGEADTHTLTKREYFAALILAALMGGDKWDLRGENARIAVNQADRLINALNKED